MTISEDDKEFLERRKAIMQCGLIPVIVGVYQNETKMCVDKYVCGCHTVPRVGEIINYGDRKLRVLEVIHAFDSSNEIDGVKFLLQEVRANAWPIDGDLPD